MTTLECRPHALLSFGKLQMYSGQIECVMNSGCHCCYRGYWWWSGEVGGDGTRDSPGDGDGGGSYSGDRGVWV